MATLGPWDTVFGVDMAAMNALLAQVRTLMPKLVNFYWPVNANGIASIGMHFADVPQLVWWNGQLQLVAPLTIEAVGASPSAYFGEVTVTMGFGVPNNVFSGAISSLSFQIRPENDTLQTLLDGGGVERMTQLLATQLIAPLRFAIPLPPGQYVPADFETCNGPEEPIFLCYTAPQWFTGTDSNADWPQGGAFLALTQAHVTAVLNPLIASVSGQGGIDSPNFSWTFGLQTRIEAIFPATGEPQLIVQVTTDASVTYHTSGILPNIGFTVPVQVSFGAPLNFAAVPGPAGPALTMAVENPTNVETYVDTDSISVLEPSLVNAIRTPLGQDVTQAVLQALQVSTTLCTIAPQTLSFPGQPPVTLSFTSPAVQTFQGPDSINLVALLGQPTLAFS
jgi:hypothetical protein